MIVSIFLDLNLPNPTTWFYFSGLLAIALFFKFSRLLSVRNLDVLTLFLFMPGLLLLAEVGPHNFFGYLGLMIACFYFLLRCLLDLALVRRPALQANLESGGLAWLTVALFIGLVAVAVRQPINSPDPVADHEAPTDKVRKISEKAIEPYVPHSRLRLWTERGLALLCHGSVVVGLILIGWRHFDDVRAGMAAATFYLLLPYTYVLLPDSPLGVGRWDHAWAMAFVVWTIFCYRRPMLAGLFLGIASGTAFYLIILLPVWLSFYRGRGMTRFVISYVLSVGLGVALLGGLLWLNGELPSSLQSDWMTFDWQPWKRPDPATPGFWQDIPSESVAYVPGAYRVPVFLAAMALVVTSAFWPTPKTLAHVLALSAAVLISIQFWYADRGGIYVLWFLPLLLLLTFRPNLSNSVPPVPGDDWVARLGRRVRRFPGGLWKRVPMEAAKSPE